MARLPGVYDIFNNIFEEFQTIWLISDTHFGEQDLKENFPKRPSDEDLVKKINSCAGKNDLVIFLGDCGDISYIKKIRANKWLIKGNHDKGKTHYQRVFWKEKFDKEIFATKAQAKEEMNKLHPNYFTYFIDERFTFTSPFTYWYIIGDNRLFDYVFEGPVILGEKLILSHEPINVSWAYNIHGHNHEKVPSADNGLNICLDAFDYNLLNLNKFLKEGHTSNIQTLHKTIINKQTQKAKRRKNT